MLITINISCENNRTHPIKLDISDWDNWIIVDSPCKKKYGKLFGDMTPCAQNVKSIYYHTRRSLKTDIVESITKRFKLNKKTIDRFKQFASIIQNDSDTLKFFIKSTIDKLLKFGEQANTTIIMLVQESNEYIQQLILDEISSQKRNKTLQISREIDITTELINELIEYTQSDDKNQHIEKIKQLLTIIKEEQIDIAAPIIFRKIEDDEPLNDEYIETILKLKRYNKDKYREYLHSKRLYLIEPSLLILEKINPPDIIEIAAKFVEDITTLKNIAVRIIRKEAKKQHAELLIKILKESEDPSVLHQTSKILSKIKTKEIINTLSQFIKQNPQTPETRKHIIYATLIRMQFKAYVNNPLKILEDFKPNAKEIKIILEAIRYNLWDKNGREQKIINAIVRQIKKHIKNKDLSHHKRKIYAEIIRKFG
ncbi:MAG: hypothetical protein KatS3mg087_1516 [Patescibacteria group bacterium]|nr:MAG: hypothetical protein KatS3mg087_1516 [Patescibacteria group bacterium]